MKTAKILSIFGSILIISASVLGTSYANSEVGHEHNSDTDHSFIKNTISLSEIASTSATLDFTAHQSGTAHYVILPSGAKAPTAEQIKAGEDAYNKDALSDYQMVAQGDDEFDISGLEPSTEYAVYFVAQDKWGNMTSVECTWFKTLDTTPILHISANTSAYTTLDLNVGEPGTAHYVVLPSEAKAPTAEQIKAGHDSYDKDALGDWMTVTEGTDEFDISGLAASTKYTVYFMAQDELGNMTPMVCTSFTTL